MNRALIANFARQDLKDRYTGSVLGGLWAFITPLINILMFVLIFSKLMGARVPGIQGEFQEMGYSIYLISGMLPWAAMSTSILRIMTVYREKAGLIGKVHISLAALPVYIIVVETFIFAVSMGFFLLMLLAIGYPIESTWLALLPVYVLQQLFAFGLGLLLAVLSVFIEDIRELMPVFVQFWFWLTPIVYVITILPDSIAQFMQLNPFYPLVNAYRAIIMQGQWPNVVSLWPVAAMAAVLLTCALFLLRKLERDIRDFV